jgi:tRNA A37 methylthiotransferase MiaB
LEGIADTKGEELKAGNIYNPEKIIGRGEYKNLDKFFARKCLFEDIGEINKPYGRDKGNHIVQICRGCNDRCSYCGDKPIVKNLHSKSLSNCIAEVKRGIELGYRRIDLLGDDAGAYGIDLNLSIFDLLKEIIKLRGDFEVTIREINIKYLVRDLGALDKILAYKKIPWLCIGLQSGNDRILQLMDRGYLREEVEELLKLLSRHKVKKRFIAIVGFPTETFPEFNDTLSIIKKGDFCSGILFKYEDREYAPAYKILPKVSEYEKNRRMDIANRILSKDNFLYLKLPDRNIVWKKWLPDWWLW